MNLMADNTPTASSAGELTTPVYWPRVKEILDGAIADWRAANNNRVPKLKQKHGPAFGWDTKADLLAATAVIGSRTGWTGTARCPTAGPT
jgi:hypothetical protein